MKRCVICLILGAGLGVWGDRLIAYQLTQLPLPDFVKSPIIQVYKGGQ